MSDFHPEQPPKKTAEAGFAVSGSNCASLHWEFRTPLTSIIGYVEILLEDVVDLGADSFCADLEKILESGKQLLALVDTALNPGRFHGRVVESELDEMAATIRHDVRARLNPIIGYCELLIEEAVAEGLKALLPDLEKILVAARQLVQLADSIISLTFLEDAPAQPSAESFVTRSADASDLRNSLKPKAERAVGRILVVDDDPMNAALLTRYLERQGYEVGRAGNGLEALAVVAQGMPDLMLLDVFMPELDGFGVLERLKAEFADRAMMPVIVLSSSNEMDHIVRCIEMGAEDYLTRPLNQVLLRARIGASLEKKRLRDTEVERLEELNRANTELQRRNAELKSKNAELEIAHRQANRIFSALAEALPGTVLDAKFQLESKIGEGGFGVIFRGTQLALNRPVAVKIFRPQGGNDSVEALERFRREGVSACRVNHPNAVAVLDSGVSHEGIAYMVMELLVGHSLADELKSRGRFSSERAVAIALPLCDALAAAHQEGVIHRDIKPDNVFLHLGPEGEAVKVVDFGIAKLVGAEFTGGETLTGVGMLVGTGLYMSPERIVGLAYDGRTDVYSAGIVLYQMLTGRLPFDAGDEGNFVTLAMKHLSQPVPPPRRFNPEIPEELEAVILRMLAKDPNDRPTAAELVVELDDIAVRHGFEAVVLPRRTPRALTTGRLKTIAAELTTDGDDFNSSVTKTSSKPLL